MVLRQMTVEDIEVGKTVYVNSDGIVVDKAKINWVYRDIPGGVWLDHRVLGQFNSWNVDSLLVEA